jgi:hypothetical protein
MANRRSIASNPLQRNGCGYMKRIPTGEVRLGVYWNFFLLLERATLRMRMYVSFTQLTLLMLLLWQCV